MKQPNILTLVLFKMFCSNTLACLKNDVAWDKMCYVPSCSTFLDIISGHKSWNSDLLLPAPLLPTFLRRKITHTHTHMQRWKPPSGSCLFKTHFEDFISGKVPPCIANPFLVRNVTEFSKEELPMGHCCFPASGVDWMPRKPCLSLLCWAVRAMQDAYCDLVTSWTRRFTAGNSPVAHKMVLHVSVTCVLTRTC